MGETTKISWAHHTWNWIQGCHRVSEECRFCYISNIIRKQKRPAFEGPFRSKTTWRQPYKWDREAEQAGEPRRVFTCSLSDFFHPGADQWRDEAWQVIRECTNLTWMVLTKRIGRAIKHLPDDWGDGWDHVWLGVTCGVRSSESRVAALINTPAKTRFVSAEPLLENVQLGDYLHKIDQLIAGGESGNNRRTMNMDHMNNLFLQCVDSNTAFFCKQDSGQYEGRQGRIPDRLWNIKEFPGDRLAQI